MNAPLHPNLARLASAYDEIFERWSRNQIDAAQARSEISALVARDDEGILWSIDPDTGNWLRRTRTGDLVPDNPPTYGFATPTAHDLSSNADAFNPDTRIAFHRVDDQLLAAPSSLAGSTRRGGRIVVKEHNAEHTRLLRLAVVLLVVLAAIVAAWVATRDGGEPTAPPATVPVTPTTLTP